MEALLANYYVEFKPRVNTDWIILCILHELRIVSFKQIYELINLTFPIAEKNLRRQINQLKDKELIDFMTDDKLGNAHYYFMTRDGHNSIGGYYPYPKVPQYNLFHHLMVTNALINVLTLFNEHPHLLYVQSERRQVFEVKDCDPSKKGKIYNVSDFLFCFEAKSELKINWYFEIELTMKTKNRYTNNIFPKYLALLQRDKNARLIYVTPSKSIFRELELFKGFYLHKKKKEVGEKADELFERLHIFSSESFEDNLKKIIAEDEFINW